MKDKVVQISTPLQKVNKQKVINDFAAVATSNSLVHLVGVSECIISEYLWNCLMNLKEVHLTSQSLAAQFPNVGSALLLHNENIVKVYDVKGKQIFQFPVNGNLLSNKKIQIRRFLEGHGFKLIGKWEKGSGWSEIEVKTRKSVESAELHN